MNYALWRFVSRGPPPPSPPRLRSHHRKVHALTSNGGKPSALRVALPGLALAALGLAPSVQAQTVTRTYTTPGTFSFIDPTGVTFLSLTLEGAGGGGNTSIGSYGGSGAFVSGTLAVTPGTTYDILVGAGGISSSSYKNGGGGGVRSAFQTAAGNDLAFTLLSEFNGGAGNGHGNDGDGGDGSVTLCYAAPAPVPEASTTVSFALLLALGGVAWSARRKKGAA